MCWRRIESSNDLFQDIFGATMVRLMAVERRYCYRASAQESVAGGKLGFAHISSILCECLKLPHAICVHLIDNEL